MTRHKVILVALAVAGGLSLLPVAMPRARAGTVCASFACISFDDLDFEDTSHDSGTTSGDLDSGGASNPAPRRNYTHEAAVAWIQQGEVDEARGDLDAADNAYTKALNLEPGNVEAEQKRQAERNRRIAKADTTIAPIKQAQIMNRLRVLGEPSRLAKAQATIARLGISTPTTTMTPIEMRHALDAVSGVRVKPGGAVSPEALRQAQSVIASAAVSGRLPANPGQLQQAQAVVEKALLQPGTKISAGSRVFGSRGVTADQFRAEVERVRELFATMAAVQGGTGHRFSGPGSAGGAWPALGQLKTMAERLGGDPSGLCFDRNCTPSSTQGAARVNVPGMIAAYGKPPAVPLQVVASPHGPAVVAEETAREKAVAAGEQALERRDRLEQQPNLEPDSYERTQAIKRANGEAANNAVKALKASAKQVETIDRSFHIPAQGAQP